MDNQSALVPNQSAAFDSALEKHISSSNIEQVSVMQKNACIKRAISRGFLAFKQDRAAAVIFSVFFHIAAAIILCIFTVNAAAPAASERLQVIHVNWVDAALFARRPSLAVPSKTQQSPASAIGQILNLQKEEAPAEKRTISSLPEEKKKALVLDNVNVAQAGGVAGQNAIVEPPAHDSRPIITPEQDVKNYGAGNSFANTAAAAKPRYRENAPPQYPLSARLRGYEGVALIAAEILTDGRTGKLKIKSSSGYSILDQSAMEAVKMWKFDPAREMGKPVCAWVEIPVRFVLKK